ncbi:GntR family transcriptional regulator [Citricoccus sp. I39-566]|uniref:GntR family transcriptional regulator n=1 Tax=Citricoccus sp. I39-566 TaxID=3073268 RepID=UPI00286C3DB6|nr:GntR family transcriptional regulator [Citricoccus sp. I39-566]WMY77294.1 GntR family transcriptional regulator [Citricoccus sp. I39-566]
MAGQQGAQGGSPDGPDGPAPKAPAKAPARPVPDWLATALTVKSGSTVPPYEQVRTGLLDLIHRNRLPVGSKLPTVRALAAALGVSANTVARAYKELEQASVVTARPRLGTVVAQGGDSAESQLAAAASAYAEVARALGFGRREAARQLDAVFPS